ncbi:MAG: methyltransferase domain-containing protein [Planctomycetota bacterium]|nr:methyltransferase domain-containing protein [Planctomycetota bacterium]
MTQPNASRARGLDLFAASAAALLMELACIRWISANVRLVAYSVNIILIGAFLGLGLGFLSSRRDWRRFLVPLLLLLAVAIALFRRVGTTVPKEAIDVWSSFGLDAVTLLARHVPFQPIIIFFFALVVLIHVPPGQMIGRLMEGMSPLTAYAINIAGSIAGVAAFASMGALGCGPPVWLATTLILILFLLRDRRLLLGVSALFGVAVLAFTVVEDRGTVWSPYQKITIRERAAGFDLYVNDDRHQFALDLRPAVTGPTEIEWRRVYDFPYRAARTLDNVLIVGAGSGNDAAAALRNGARHVDAVDIDPEILRIGRDRHPERPYSNPRVTVHVDDARAFFKRAGPKYDLIVFAYLDSHALFSNMANVRLDEYVYTRESFKEAHARLYPGGTMCVVFCATKDWIRAKLVRLLTDAAGRRPQMTVMKPQGVDTTILWTGPEAAPDRTDSSECGSGWIEVPCDDWPFLYLERRAFPVEYLPVLGVVLLIAIATLAGSVALGRGKAGKSAIVPSSEQGAGVGLKPAASTTSTFTFFLLGAGFMLLETLSITRFALLAGSTWIITSVTVAAILLVALISTWIASRFERPGPRLALVLTIAAVAAAFATPVQALVGLPLGARLAAGGVVIGLPVLFSGIAFARLFKDVKRPSAALGANLLGAVLGGLFENVSVITGFSALYVAAAFLYAAALVMAHFRQSRLP